MLVAKFRAAWLYTPFDQILKPAFAVTNLEAKFQAQASFFYFARIGIKNPILTGRTMQETSVEISNKRVLIYPNLPSLNVKYRFLTVNTGDYAQFPYFGIGTSTKYGPRKWLVVAAKETTLTFEREVTKLFN